MIAVSHTARGRRGAEAGNTVLGRTVGGMGTVTATAARSLADDLRARSDEELAALLRARPDLATPLPADIGQLASRAATRASAARALDRLDRFTLTVVEALAVLPEPAPTDDVVAVVGAPADATTAALGGLRMRALIWGAPEEIRLVRTVHEILGPFPAGLGPPLERALASHAPARLATIASNLGIEPTGDMESDAAAIAGAVTDRLDELLGEVSDGAVAALRELCAGPPTGRLGNARRNVGIAAARTPMDELLARGLLVPTGDSTVVLPREVGLRLRGGRLAGSVAPEPPRPRSTPLDPRTVDRTAAAGAYDAVRRVETLLETWSREPPAVLRTGGLGVRELRRLPAMLDVDEPAAGLLLELAYAAGLLAAGRDADPVWLPTPAFDTWRDQEPERQWATLAAAWLTTSRTAGLIGGRDERGRLLSPLGTELDRPLAPEIRRTTLDVLAGLPAGAAPEPDDVADAVRYLRPRRAARLRDDLVRWTLREAETLGVTGRGALASYVRPLLAGQPAADAAAALRPALPDLLDHVLL
ncbi:MAG: DNA-binding protein, partial [Jiangellaceae bacterium]